METDSRPSATTTAYEELGLTDEQIAFIETPSPPGKRTKEWWDLHPEERDKARLRAQVQVAERRLGPASRRRIAPAYEIAAAHAAVNGVKLANELVKQATDQKLKASDRRDAIKMLFDMEQRVRQERRDEEDHLMSLAGDELTKELLNVISKLTGDQDLANPFVDATSEEGHGDPEQRLALEAG